jgi:DNA-binding NarL/FixJ family response regulator
MLTDLGYVVIGPAATVGQALALVEAEAIDAAVLDINLNGELSYAVADALAARGAPYVFVSGYDCNSIPEGYRTAPFLQKPLRLAELGEAVGRVLTGGQPRARRPGNDAETPLPASRPPGSAGSST